MFSLSLSLATWSPQRPGGEGGGARGDALGLRAESAQGGAAERRRRLLGLREAPPAVAPASAPRPRSRLRQMDAFELPLRPLRGVLRRPATGSSASSWNDVRDELCDHLPGVAGPQRLAHLSASPLELPPLDVQADVAAVQEALPRGLVEIEPGIASVASLAQAATRRGNWLHLSAHTAEKGQLLMLEREEGQLCVGVQPLGLAELRRLLRESGGVRCSLVVLAACESEAFAQVFRAAGAQHVVFCPTSIKDRRAASFARSLYDSLANHMSLDHAFGLARCTAELSGDEAHYGLLSDGDLRLQMLTALQPSWLAPRQSRRKSRAPALRRRIEDFVGRVDVMRSVLACLGTSERRTILLHCVAPLGVSATLCEIADLVTRPGRRFSKPGSCAFFPDEAPGGLLIVDRADELTGHERERVQEHLAVQGSQLLVGCRSTERGGLLAGDNKPMLVELLPLKDTEASELFLKRCQRPLQVSDLFPQKEIGTRSPTEVVARGEALRLLRKPIAVFAGVPGKIRLAVDGWARRGSPTLHGDLGRLTTPSGVTDLPALSGAEAPPGAEGRRRLAEDMGLQGPIWRT